MYKSMPLTYEYSSLEPYIDTRTIGIHYNNHYKGYLDRLNRLLNEVNYDYRYSLKELPNHIEDFPLSKRGDILFNLGGVLNHELYFKNMSPNKNTEPKGILKEEIIKKYGSIEKFKKEFIDKTKKIVGSGYTFLVLNDNELQIINFSNQETPYTYGMLPLMTIDLWEHAYYLKYQNNKDEYINNFFKIIDFDVVEELYINAIK